MRFRQDENGGFEVSELHPLFAGMIGDLPRAASCHEGAEERIYPDPVAGVAGEILSDWREHVRPGLEHLFASSREIVAKDVAAVARESRCAIPAKHFDAWLNALNQARLAIAGRNGFTEADLDRAEPPDLTTKRGIDLLRIHFYAELQGLLLEAMEPDAGA